MSHGTNQSDFERGMDLLRVIGGHDFDGPINSLAAVSKDMANLTVAFPYGQVLSRDH
jgi:4-carboxymuconolactone decarboxylase